MADADSIDLSGYVFKPFPKNRDHFNDVSGGKFHHLEVVGYLGGGKWLCRCVCGTLKAVPSVGLLFGDYRSCGCRQYNERKRMSEDEYKQRQKESQRASRERHRDKRNEACRKYYHANREREWARNAEWRRRNPEKTKAIRRRIYSKHGEQIRSAASQYYAENTDARCEYVMRNYRSKQAYLDALKAQYGCQECGENDYQCLEFHHPDRSNRCGSVTNFTRYAWRRLLAEINKTVILCVNCHVRADAEIDGRDGSCRGQDPVYLKNKAYVDSIKIASGCRRCGERDPVCLVFHHRNPRDKTAGVASVCIRGRKAVKRELKKCEVLCCNCHCKLHGITTRRGPRLLVKNHVEQLLLFDLD